MPSIDLLVLEIAYIVSFVVFVVLLYPRTRHCLRKLQWYQNRLNVLTLIRQILFFIFPLWVAAVVSPSLALAQLPTLIALGLSIIIFWVVELPLLMKADIFVDFGVDDGSTIEEKNYRNEVVLSVDKDNIVNIRIKNMGFSTLKNATVAIYFGDVFKVLRDSERYEGLDFCKKFSLQKRHCGVMFTSRDNFQTIPPQEVLIFPTIVQVIKENMQKAMIEIQFSSENSWGLKKVRAPIKIIGDKTKRKSA